MRYPCLIAGLGILPPITGLSTLPIFTNSGGLSATLPSQSTALAMGRPCISAERLDRPLIEYGLICMHALTSVYVYNV